MKNIILLFFFVSVNLHAVSFDCEKATSKMEKAICGTSMYADSLNGLDSRLSDKYNLVRSTLNEPEKKKLITEQREWLKDRDNTCGLYSSDKDIKKCLSKTYQERITYFDSKYKNILLPFPEKEKLLNICTSLANNPREYIEKHKIKFDDDSEKFDINNDGVDELVTVKTEGTMRVSYTVYEKLYNKDFGAMEIGFEWKDYWTYGLEYLRVDGITYKLTSEDDHLTKLSYLSYITQANEEYIMCEFEPTTVSTLYAHENVKNSKAICDAVENEEVSYISIENAIEKPNIKNYNPFWSLHGLKQGKVDFDNDGTENDVFQIFYASGAGRGCDTLYFDEVESTKKEFKKTKSRELLLEMQGVDINAFHPRCRTESRFFKYDNNVFYKETFFNEKGTKVLKLQEGQIIPICLSKEKIIHKVKSLKY